MKTRGSTKKSPPVEGIEFPGLFDENGPQLGLANLSSLPSPPSGSGSDTEDDVTVRTEDFSDNNSEDYSVGVGGKDNNASEIVGVMMIPVAHLTQCGLIARKLTLDLRLTGRPTKRTSTCLSRCHSLSFAVAGGVASGNDGTRLLLMGMHALRLRKSSRETL